LLLGFCVKVAVGPGIGAASVHVGYGVCSCACAAGGDARTLCHVIRSPLPRSRESTPAAAVQLVRRIIDPLVTSQSVVGECSDQTLFRSVPGSSSWSPRRLNICWLC